MTIKVESGIGMPSMGRPPKYPWAKMNVGDSFVLPLGRRGQAQYSAVQSANRAYATKGVRFAVRKMPNGEYRAFRVA